ncbi:MAG: hypothetical protein DME44_08410, partial [Verrucomicrobia bacterium]
QNASNSATLDLKVPQIISADFEPHFSVKHMLKDMQIANRMGRHFDLDLTVAGATRDRLLDEARQGRGDDDYSSIARRFLPFVQTPEMAERQPDLFSPRPAEVPHESPEFVEEQLAKLEATQIGQPPEQIAPEEEVAAEERETPVNIETPRQTELPPPDETTPSETPSNGDSELEEAKRGFFSRLLRRTDY